MAALVMTSSRTPVLGSSIDRRPLSRGSSSSGSTSVYTSRTPSACATPSAARTAAAMAKLSASLPSESGHHHQQQQPQQVVSSVNKAVNSGYYDDMAGEPLETVHYNGEDEDNHRSADRHSRAKAAARALLAQFMQEDSDPTSTHMTPTLHYQTRLGLAPITLLLNPETPCPTKIIPLAASTDDEDMSPSSDYASSTASEEAEVQRDRTAPPTHGFIRLL